MLPLIVAGPTSCGRKCLTTETAASTHCALASREAKVVLLNSLAIANQSCISELKRVVEIGFCYVLKPVLGSSSICTGALVLGLEWSHQSSAVKTPAGEHIIAFSADSSN